MRIGEVVRADLSDLDVPGLRLQVERHGRAIGVKLTPHVARHTCATHLLKGGASI